MSDVGISAFEHHYLSGIVGDEEMTKLFGAKAELQAMIMFEQELAAAQASCGIIGVKAANRIGKALAVFVPDISDLRIGVARDGVVVPTLVDQLKKKVGEPHCRHVHFGATSQDVVDTALVLRLSRALELLGRRLEALDGKLGELTSRYGQRLLMAHTRMQPAIAITVADRIGTWRAPLARDRARLDALLPSLLVVQFGGAAGTLEKFGDKGPAIRKVLAQRLGLADVPQWHNQRDRLAELAGWLSLVTGSLGKFGQDVALMAQGGDIVTTGAGLSSAMPHKQNPVAAEVLVTLARFNAVQLSGIHQSLVHEQERSGAAWTLEWLILPSMLMATGAATRLAKELLSGVARIGASQDEDAEGTSTP